MLASKQDILMIKFQICSTFTGLNILRLFKGDNKWLLTLLKFDIVKESQLCLYRSLCYMSLKATKEDRK